MKKTILFSACALFTSHFAEAQFYIQARNGYAFSTSISNVAGLKKLTPLQDASDDGSRVYNQQIKAMNACENFYGTGGQGFTSGGAFGYFFNKYLGAEMGISYFNSKTSLVQETTSITAAFKVDATFEAHTNQIRLMSALVVRGGDTGVQPYIRFGLCVPVYGQVDIANAVKYDTGYGIMNPDPDNPTYISQQDNTIVFNGAFSLGYNSAFGIHIPIEKHVSLNIEGELLTLGIRSGKSAVVAAKSLTRNAQTNEITDSKTLLEDAFPTVAEQKVEYVDELTPESNVLGNSGFDPTKPRNELGRVANYNSFGAHLALRYSF